MNENRKLVNWLQQLIKFRDSELREREEFNGFSEAEACYYQDETDRICKFISELEQKKECRLLNIDDAISHADEIADSADNTYASNHKQLADWLRELKIIKDKYAYLAADFDNYKKRTAKNEKYMRDKAYECVILKFLDVYDDMERLNSSLDVESIDETTTEYKECKAFQMTFNKFENTLISLGCEKLQCENGDKFDVSYMEAIAVQDIPENTDYDANEVLNIFLSGWKYNGKTIRPVKVIVTKEKEDVNA